MKLAEENLGIAYAVARAYCRKAHSWQHYDDILGDAMEGLTRAARDYRPGERSFGSFAFERVYWAIVSARRQEKRLSRKEKQALENAPMTPEEIYEAKENCHEQASKLADLHKILLGRLALGHSQAEVAKAWGVSESWISQVAAEARRRLGGPQE